MLAYFLQLANKIKCMCPVKFVMTCRLRYCGSATMLGHQISVICSMQSLTLIQSMSTGLQINCVVQFEHPIPWLLQVLSGCMRLWPVMSGSSLICRHVFIVTYLSSRICRHVFVVCCVCRVHFPARLYLPRPSIPQTPAI